MLELNELAFQNADLLILLDEEDTSGWSVQQMAERVDRDRSNLRKTLIKLAEAGVVTASVDPGLTDKGREQLAGISRARGEVSAGDAPAPQRWPADRIRRNPANRVPRAEDVAALADTVEAAGDILQRVSLTPPDANGVRMLLIGEHRWLAVQLLAEQDRLPPALAEGLPFEERDLSPADQILIRIVENSARADLSPLDDARQLLALQQETGWSAREIAKKTGRSPADSDSGVRDVQVKIKIAREATAEAIAAYEHDGGWDALRDSVTRAKGPDNPHLALFLVEAALKSEQEHGVWDAPLTLPVQLKWPIGWSGQWFWYGEHEGGFHLLKAATAWLADQGLGDDETDSVLMRMRAKAGLPHRDKREPWVSEVLNPPVTETVAKAETPAGVRPQQAVEDRIEEYWNTDPITRAREQGWSPVAAEPAGVRPQDVPTQDPLVVNGIRYPNATRAAEAKRLAGLTPNPSNSGGGNKTVRLDPTPQPSPDATPNAAPSDHTARVAGDLLAALEGLLAVKREDWASEDYPARRLAWLDAVAARSRAISAGVTPKLTAPLGKAKP